jgi:hypothetical protein
MILMFSPQLCACCPKSGTLACSACKSVDLRTAYCSVEHQKLVSPRVVLNWLPTDEQAVSIHIAI